MEIAFEQLKKLQKITYRLTKNIRRQKMAKDMRRASEKKLTQIAAAPLEARVEVVLLAKRVAMHKSCTWHD